MTQKDLQLMIEIRTVENKLFHLFSEGKIRGTIHTCIGQEAIPVGVIQCLDLYRDTIFSNHRGHGHFIAATNNTRGFLAEIMGKAGAVCQGMGGTQHLHSQNYYSNGIQGGVPGIATGIGLAHKLTGQLGVSVAFLGDGTFGEGLTYEVLNMASLWSLPVLYVVEDNGIAQSTPSLLNTAGSLLKRFESFRIPALQEDGQDIEIVKRATQIALSHIRSGYGPYGLIFKTHRFAPHSKGDDTRSQKDIEDFKKRDPIEILVSKEDALKKMVPSIQRMCEIKINGLIEELDTRPLTNGFLNPRNEIAPTIKKIESSSFEGSVADRLNRTLIHLMKTHSNVVLLGEDIADPYGGAFKITKGLDQLYKDRVLTTPISEAGILATANGLALRGFRPIAEIMFGDFLFLTADQIINHACKFKTMYGKDIDFSLVIRTPMGGRRGYGPSHSQSVEKFFFGHSNLLILAINHLVDPGELLTFAVEATNCPVLFIENKMLYTQKEASLRFTFKKTVFHEENGTRIVNIVPKTQTSDVLLIGYGGISPFLVQTAEDLFNEDIYTEIIIPEQVSPLGNNFLDLILKKKLPVLIVEESTTDFGWGAEIAANLKEKKFLFPIKRLGATHDCIPSAIHLENQVLVQSDNIKQSVFELLI